MIFFSLFSRRFIFRLSLLSALLIGWHFSPLLIASELQKEMVMADDHPIKSQLDALFSSSRVTLNLKTLREAGFDRAKPRKFTKLIVTKHPSFPGYVFKLYLDAQRPHKNTAEDQFWKMRVEGANQIRAYIEDYQLESLFKVPQKWIYRLPKHPRPPEGYYLRKTILVEEDMDLLSNKENEETWKSDLITYSLLDALYLILRDIGLKDCCRPENIPFSSDGRIAFIDTQTHGSKTVNFSQLNPYLSPKNKRYWKMVSK